MRRSLIIFAAGVLIVGTHAAHAHAQGRVIQHVRVSTAGVDLDSPAGAQLMLTRLKRAAVRACGDHPLVAPLAVAAIRRFEACRGQALDQAVADLGSPSVAALHSPRPATVRLASR